VNKCEDCRYFSRVSLTTNASDFYCHEYPQPVKLPSSQLPACRAFKEKAVGVTNGNND